MLWSVSYFSVWLRFPRGETVNHMFFLLCSSCLSVHSLRGIIYHCSFAHKLFQRKSACLCTSGSQSRRAAGSSFSWRPWPVNEWSASKHAFRRSSSAFCFCFLSLNSSFKFFLCFSSFGHSGKNKCSSSDFPAFSWKVLNIIIMEFGIWNLDPPCHGAVSFLYSIYPWFSTISVCLLCLHTMTQQQFFHQMSKPDWHVATFYLNV